MFDESTRLVGDSVQTRVNEPPANGSAAEPGLADHGGEPVTDSAAGPQTAPVAGLSNPFEVPLADLEWTSRSNDQDELKSLAASLKVMQINDIIVTPKTTSGKYGVIAGNRRCAAAAWEGIPILRARIYQGGAGDIVSIVENAQRVEESPKSLLLRLRKALGDGTNRKEVREFLGATGKARSTISDLLYGALLDQDRFQTLIDSANVFKAIAELRRHKPADAPPPLFAAAGETSTAHDEQRDPKRSVAERVAHPHPESALFAAAVETSMAHVETRDPKRSVTERMVPPRAESVSAQSNGASHGLEEATPDGDKAEAAPVPVDASASSLEPGLSNALAERNGDDPVEESGVGAGAADDTLRIATATPAASCSAETSVPAEPAVVQRVVVHPYLQVPLADWARTEAEKSAAGAWSLALVRPAQSQDVPVNTNLAQMAILELGRRC